MAMRSASTSYLANPEAALAAVSRYAAILLVLMGLPTGVVLNRAFGADNPKPPSPQERLRAESPLHYELLFKHYDHALKAMPGIDDVDAIDSTTGLTALGLASKDESADAIDVVRPLVLTYVADVQQADAVGNTALHYASAAGNMAVVLFLIDNGADVNAANRMGITPLYFALRLSLASTKQLIHCS